MPEQAASREGKLQIDGAFRVQISGHRDPLLERAADRLIERLKKKTGIPFITPATLSQDDHAALRIHCGGPAEPVQSLNADESYEIRVTDRYAQISAPSPVGVLRALETFVQLVDLDGDSFFVPCIEIKDRPRFRWRGLHMDVARHWQPAEIIRRNLDAMAAAKLNVFHWHLSDDQGFRVESKIHPKLHQMGSDGQYYSQDEIRKLVAYARDRGIRVVPEFDLPGHSTAWLVGYPELGSAPGPYQIIRSWGVFEACLDPSREEVYAFLDSFIGEMATLFPDEYFHIGGDEVNEKQWNANVRIRDFKNRMGFKSNRELQAYFNTRMLKIVGKHKKKMIGWDDIINPGLPQNVVVQAWRRQAPAPEVARKGYSVILSRGYYLDAMQPASYHYQIDPHGSENKSLTEEESARILGGEACMWAEFVNPDNIESRIWPRAATIAERLWSPANLTDVQDMYRRLEFFTAELELLGLRYRANKVDMIRRMAGGRKNTPLLILSDLLVPLPLSARPHRKYSSHTPLNRMVDAVLPESEAARRLDDKVKRLLATAAPSPEIAQDIRNDLESWRENRDRVAEVLNQSFLLKELVPVSETVAELCSRGLEALEYLQSGRKPSEAWRKEAAALLARAEKPQAEMLPAIAGPIKRIVQAVN